MYKIMDIATTYGQIYTCLYEPCTKKTRLSSYDVIQTF